MAPKPPAVPAWLTAKKPAKLTPQNDAFGAKQTYATAEAPTIPDWMKGAKAQAAARSKIANATTQKGGLKGNLASIGHIVESLPTSLAHLGKTVVTDPVINPIYELKRGFSHPFGGGPETHGSPTGKMFAESGKLTAHAIAHPSDYVKAYHEGRLPAQVINDLANVSIVGSVAAAPLRAASARAAIDATVARGAATAASRASALGGAEPGLLAAATETAGRASAAETAAQAAARTVPARLGNAVHSVATLGAQGAALPIKPFEWAAKGLKGAGELSGVTPYLAQTAFGDAVKGLGERAAARRTVNRFIADEAQTPFAQRAHDIVAPGPKALKGMSQTENRAAVLLATEQFADAGTRARLGAIAEHGGEAALEAYWQRINPEVGVANAGHTITPEAVRLAIEHVEGKTTPKVAERLDSARSYLAEVSKVGTEDALAGRGRLTGPLNPEELGTKRLTEMTEQHPTVVRTRGELERVKGLRDEAATKLTRAEERTLDKEIATETRVGRAQERIESASPRQAALEGRRARLTEETLRQQVRSEEALTTGQERSATLRAEGAAKRNAILGEGQTKAGRLVTAAEARAEAGGNLARLAGEVSDMASERRNLASNLADANQLTSGTPLIGGAAGPEFRGALRSEAAAGKVAERAGHEFVQETRLRQSAEKVHVDSAELAAAREAAAEIRAQGAESNAVDAAIIAEGRAATAEATQVRIAGDTPMADVAGRELKRTVATAEKSGASKAATAQEARRFQVLDKRVSSLETRLSREVEKRWNALDSAPTRYRPAWHALREADNVLADLQAAYASQGADYAVSAIQKLREDYPVGLEALVERNIDPQYLPGGFDPNTRRASQLRMSRGTSTLSVRKQNSELQRRTQVAPATVEGRVAKVVADARQGIYNEAAQKFGAEHGVTAEKLGLPKSMRAENLVDEMRARGKEAWDPAAPYSTPSTTAVGRDTVFVDAAVKKQIGKYWKPAGDGELAMRALFDPVRRAWKDTVLPVSGAWHMGNVVSNAIMNTISTGFRWIPELGEAIRWRMGRDLNGEVVPPARLSGLTLEHGLDDWLRKKTGKRPNIFRRGLNGSYAVNAFVDDISRASVYLAEHQKLTSAGMDAAAAERAALHASLKSAGDFTRLTPFEQQYMRRIFPFYTWMRHVTQFTSNLAIHDPIRLIWTLHLAELYNDPDGGPFHDAFTTKGGIISIGNLSPLGQAANLYFNEKGPLAGFTSSVGPEFGVLAAALGGINTKRGLAPLRLPPGLGNKDAFGNDTLTPLIGHPKALARYAGKQVPLLQTALALNAGERLATYDEGSPMLRNKRLIDSTPKIPGTNVGGRLGILAKQAGVPTEQPFSSAESIKATTSKRLTAAASQRERYQKQLARAKQLGA